MSFEPQENEGAGAFLAIMASLVLILSILLTSAAFLIFTLFF